jgi:hypothetical protein
MLNLDTQGGIKDLEVSVNEDSWGPTSNLFLRGYEDVPFANFDKVLLNN